MTNSVQHMFEGFITAQRPQLYSIGLFVCQIFAYLFIVGQFFSSFTF